MNALTLFASRRPRGWRTAGFTLPEALVGLAILAIMSVLAMPAMQGLVQNYRLKTASSDMFFSLTLARSEAIKRATTVTLVPSGPSWESGWRILDAAGDLIKLQPSYTGGVHIAGPDTITYEKDGRLPQAGVTPTFNVTMENPASTVHPRCVRVDLTGRPNSRSEECQ